MNLLNIINDIIVEVGTSLNQEAQHSIDAEYSCYIAKIENNPLFPAEYKSLMLQRLLQEREARKGSARLSNALLDVAKHLNEEDKRAQNHFALTQGHGKKL